MHISSTHRCVDIASHPSCQGCHRWCRHHTGCPMAHSKAESRLIADPTVTVAMLEEDIETWLRQCTTRDMLSLLSLTRLTCGPSYSPGRCVPGLVSIARLLNLCLKRLPNAVIHRTRFTQALMNVHKRQEIYIGERSIRNVADEITSYVRVALSKVSHARWVDTALHAHHTSTCPPVHL